MQLCRYHCVVDYRCGDDWCLVTSTYYLVVYIICSVFPDDFTDIGRSDVQKILSAVSNNVPCLLEEMEIGRAGQKLARKNFSDGHEANFLRVNGPIVTRHMREFGAKLGLALYFELFKKALPQSGGVSSIWYSNVQAARKEIPEELLELFPDRWTLAQGKKQVGNQFQYVLATTAEETTSVFYASFHESFAVASVATPNPSWLKEYSQKFPVFHPGDFRVRGTRMAPGRP